MTRFIFLWYNEQTEVIGPKDRETDLILTTWERQMIFHIRLTCNDCGDSQHALLEARNRDQARRICRIVQRHSKAEVLERIETAERGNEHVLCFYEPLDLHWLRATEDGWHLIPPQTNRGANAHRSFIDMEFSANLDERLSK